MVDCHPEETLSTEVEPRSTMLSEGWRSTMSSRKECNIFFIMPNVPISFTTSSICDEKSLCIEQHFTWMLPVATTLLRMPGRPPLVLGLNRTRIFSRSQHFSECYPPLYILCKNGVTFKIFKQTTDQWNYRKLTWSIIKFITICYRNLLYNLLLFATGIIISLSISLHN